MHYPSCGSLCPPFQRTHTFELPKNPHTHLNYISHNHVAHIKVQDHPLWQPGIFPKWRLFFRNRLKPLIKAKHTRPFYQFIRLDLRTFSVHRKQEDHAVMKKPPIKTKPAKTCCVLIYIIWHLFGQSKIDRKTSVNPKQASTRGRNMKSGFLTLTTCNISSDNRSVIAFLVI